MKTSKYIPVIPMSINPQALDWSKSSVRNIFRNSWFCMISKIGVSSISQTHSSGY